MGADNSTNPLVYRESIPVSLTDLSKTGYTFDGWYDAQTGGNKVTGW